MAIDFSWIRAIRRNHAAEHATIAILSRRLDAFGRLGGRAALNGFYIYGAAPTEAVEEAAREAVNRLRHGEENLAVSPFCGTNFLLAGILSAIGAGLVLGRSKRIQKLPMATAVAVGATLLSFRMGGEVQRRWTTLPAIGNLTVDRIIKMRDGPRAVHRIYIHVAPPLPLQAALS